MATPNEINSNFRQIAVTDTNGDVYGVSIVDPSYLLVGGGVAGQVLSTDGSGTLSWINAVPKTVSSTLTISATTTNPTKANAKIYDYITIIDDYSGWCTAQVGYAHTNNAGVVVGSGTYLYTLPGGYQFDTTVQPLNTQIGLLSGVTEVHKSIPAYGLIQYDSTYSYDGIYVVPHTATQFKIMPMMASPWNFLTSANWGIWANQYTIRINFRFKKA